MLSPVICDAVRASEDVASSGSELLATEHHDDAFILGLRFAAAIGSMRSPRRRSGRYPGPASTSRAARDRSAPETSSRRMSRAMNCVAQWQSGRRLAAS